MHQLISSRVQNLLIVCLALLVVSMHPAHAYIDPGTGSYVFQLVIASLVGGLFFVKGIIRRVSAALHRRQHSAVGQDARHD